MEHTSRRVFLKTTAAMAAVMASGRVWAIQPASGPRPEAKGDGKGPGLERRRFGKTDMEVTILGFGGAEIGFQKTEQEAIEKLLNSALDAGLNVIDTAECYQGSEESIGKAVSGRRKEYYLFTKVGHAEGRGPEGWTAPSIERSIDRSLQRLKTDHLDLVQLHSCDRSTLEKGECIEALEKAKKAGKTRYIGYSGDSNAAVYAVETGRFDALQISVSIADQEAIDLVLPKAVEKNLGVIAKRPIANAVWRMEESRGAGNEYYKRVRKLDYDFTKGAKKDDQGPDGAAGVALRFTLSVPGVDVAIVGTTKPERWKQNAELLRAGGPLPKAQYDAIRARWKEVAEAGWTGQT